MSTLTLDRISKTYGDTTALAPVSITVEDGQFVSVLGPSGCGKTTMLRSIAGLITPDTGRISIGDDVVFAADDKVEKPPYRRNLSMVFQDLALWPHLTTSENVAFPLKARGRTKDLKTKVTSALEAVQLTGFEKRYPHELSGGQQQRVALARAIVDEPSVLLMDEPLSALDAALKEELRAEITAITKQFNLTTIFVTHDQAEAMAMSDRILVMNAGEVAQDAPPEVLYQQPNGAFVASFVGRYNRLGEHAAKLPGNPSPTSGVRPERVRTAACDGDVSFTGVTTTTSFVGDRYEIRALMNGSDAQWLFYSPQPAGVGDQITLYINPADVVDPDSSGPRTTVDAHQT